MALCYVFNETVIIIISLEVFIFALYAQVYMIGLVRRPERRNRMIACLEELDFNYTLFDAVDGRLVSYGNNAC